MGLSLVRTRIIPMCKVMKSKLVRSILYVGYLVFLPLLKNQWAFRFFLLQNIWFKFKLGIALALSLHSSLFILDIVTIKPHITKATKTRAILIAHQILLAIIKTLNVYAWIKMAFKLKAHNVFQQHKIKQRIHR